MINTDKVLDSRVCVSANNRTLVFKDFCSPSYFLSTIGFKMYQPLLLLHVPKNCSSQKYYYSYTYIYRPQRSWGKVMFLQASVILLTGGCLVPGGGAWSQGGSAPGGGGFLVPGGPGPGGAWSWGGLLLRGAWWRPPRDGHC